MNETVILRPVESLEVTILVDNSVDVLAATRPPAGRNPLVWEWSEREQLRAEHGYSLLVSVVRGGQRDTFLYDGGLGRDTAVHNLDVLGRNPRDIRTVVLSHGHADHHGGLRGLASRLGQGSMPLVLHPDALRDRKVVFPDGTEIHMPPPNTAALEREGWAVVEERMPSFLFDSSVLVTGQVIRNTEYEHGFPLQQARTAGGWEPDTWIWDDQAAVVLVAGLGLVIMSGCSHAGIVNVVRYARQLTGVDAVHAVIGGFHLTGALFEPAIPQTVNDLMAADPAFVVPGHCTGWRATQLIAATIPDAFIPSNLGTTFTFKGSR